MILSRIKRGDKYESIFIAALKMETVFLYQSWYYLQYTLRYNYKTNIEIFTAVTTSYLIQFAFSITILL
jgi:hypothetical protein